VNAPPSFPGVRVEAQPALTAAVTIVVSVKDQFGRTRELLDSLRSAAPGVPLIMVLSGPVWPAMEAMVREQAGRTPNLRLLETGLDFGNSYELRNLAIPQVATPYVMFLFNDVFPANERWLSDLVRCAELHPEADLFQPFIWEDATTPHAAWKDLYFVLDRGEVHPVHPFDHDRKAIQDPSLLPWSEQRAFLEDHAFLARTGFMRKESILDPGCAYAKEFLDMALSVKYRGSRIWSVPTAQVLYQVPFHLTPEDLPYFTHRRSEEVCAGSEEHLRRKWQIKHAYDGIGRKVMNANLAGAEWSGTGVPDDPIRQWEMAIAMFCAVGYNRFDLQIVSPEIEGLDLPGLHRHLRQAARENVGKGCGITLKMRRAQEPRAFPDFTPDYEQRRKALRSGRLFPIKTGHAVDPAAGETGMYFEPFMLVELSDLRGPEGEILRTFGPHASLVLRESGGPAEGTYTAWVHARYLPKERALAERLCGMPASRSQRRDSTSIAGDPRRGVQVRVHRSDEGIAVNTPLHLGVPSRGWRLLQWAWRPQDLLSLERVLALAIRRTEA